MFLTGQGWQTSADPRKSADFVVTDLGARHVLRERKLNQKVELPDPNDIAILANHMKKRMEQSVRPETYDEFKELQYDTLARLIAFNRRRPGELQVMRYN